jgi:hypothetical protein
MPDAPDLPHRLLHYLDREESIIDHFLKVFAAHLAKISDMSAARRLRRLASYHAQSWKPCPLRSQALPSAMYLAFKGCIQASVQQKQLPSVDRLLG